jgi:uncharacterized protein
MNKRYEILDILKGFALLCIFILHFNQQFEIENNYVYQSDMLNSISNFLKSGIEKILSGNVYLIFSLIFGINLNYGLKNKTSKSFLFRLFLILIIGYIHSLFYNGDILIYYGLLGLILLFINNLSLKYIYLILGISLLKMPLVIQIIASFDSTYEFFSSYDVTLLQKAHETYTNKGILDVFYFNAIEGKYLAIKHYLLTDRIGSIFAFFLMGLIVYKKNLLSKIETNLPIIKKYIFIIFIILVVILLLSKISFSSNFKLALAIKIYLISLQSIASSILFTLMITYLYYKNVKFNFLKFYGSSSLTIYLTQSLIGVFLFYNFGMDLGNKIGLLHGIGLMIASILSQILFLKFWCSKFEKGPFEMILFNLSKMV